jgi:hypothetical protein
MINPALNTYRSLKKEFKKYLKAVLMLVSDAYNLNKKRFIVILVISAAGLGLMGGCTGYAFTLCKAS